MPFLITIQFSKKTEYRLAGVISGEATPDPIPNSEVKLSSGDGTARETVCESSTMPAFFCRPTYSIKLYVGFFLTEEQ